MKEQYQACPETLMISIDTKTKVAEGDYSRNGHARTDSAGQTPLALDHDEPAKQKWTPFGILVLLSGALTILFNASKETSDFWADGLEHWWSQVRHQYPSISRLVLFLDKGPKCSGRCTQWLKRMVAFADQFQITIRLVYYPPYHSKYNPIERCGGALEQKWNGTLLNSIEIILAEARRMIWLQKSPTVEQLVGTYQTGVSVSKAEMSEIERRLERKAELSKYDIIIRPQPRGQAPTVN